jgi:hypothetical protein
MAFICAAAYTLFLLSVRRLTVNFSVCQPLLHGTTLQRLPLAWLLLLLAGGIPPIGHDSNIKVLVDCRLQEAAAAAVADGSADQEAQQQHQHEQQQAQVSGASRPAGGGWGAVAAAAVTAAVEQHTDAHYATAGIRETPNISSKAAVLSNEAAAASVTAAGGPGGVPAGATKKVAAVVGSRLVLQCGADAVIHLSFEQLLQLSRGTVADVADMPAVSGAAASISTAQGAATGQQQQEGGGPGASASSGGQTSAVSCRAAVMVGRGVQQ